MSNNDRLTNAVAKMAVFLTSVLVFSNTSGAQDGTIVQRNDKVNNVIIINDKMVVRQQLPTEKSGIRLNTETVSPETYAKEQAIENRLDGEVNQNNLPQVVKGEIDNIIQAEGIFAIKRSTEAKACIEIGVIGNDDACQKKR
jgi:hypothetical protein